MKNIKIEIKWAVIFSLVFLTWVLLEKLCGLHGKHIEYQNYTFFPLAILITSIYVLTLKDKKKNFYNGQMSYLQGLISGIIMTVVFVVLYPLTQWIISYVITPEYFPNFIKYSVETGIFKTTAEAEARFNYWNFVKESIIVDLLMGILTTAIIMIFLRSKKK